MFSWDNMFFFVLRNMKVSIINLFLWPITQNIETCHYRRTQLCYVLCTSWCGALILFEVGRISPLHLYVPFHYTNRKAILLGIQWFIDILVKQFSQVEPTASSLVMQYMFMVLRRIDHLNDSYFTAYQMLLLLLWLGHAGGPISWYKRRYCWDLF